MIKLAKWAGKVQPANETPLNVLRVRERMADCADQIMGMFKSAKITIIVRSPQVPNGTVVLTDDEPDQIRAAFDHIMTDQAAAYIPPDEVKT
jgi:ABC-type phosphate/phosphonate transport system substrate-binding protein